MTKIESVIVEVAKSNNIKIDISNKSIELKKLGIDSLAAMNLIMQIEEKMSKTLDDSVLINIKTLDDLIKAFS